MNRRTLLQSLGAVGAWLGLNKVVHAAPVEETPFGSDKIIASQPFINRIERYRAYDQYIAENPSLLSKDVINPIAQEVYNETVAKLPPVVINEDLSVFKIGMIVYNLAIYGDWFSEMIMDPESLHLGCLKVQSLPADTMYRIETIKGRVVEYQQSKEGPDYRALHLSIEEDSNNFDATAIRFHPSQILHIRTGVGRYYPYGTSLLEVVRHGKPLVKKPYFDQRFKEQTTLLGKPLFDQDFKNDLIKGVNTLIDNMFPEMITKTKR